MSTATTTDPRATYEAAARRHHEIGKRYREAAGRVARIQHTIAAIESSGIGNILRGEAAEVRLARARQRLVRAEAEQKRIDAEERVAREEVARLQAELTGEVYQAPAQRPVRKSAPVTVRPIAPLDELQSAKAAGTIVSRDYHEHSIAYAREEEQRKAAVREFRLRELLEMAHADRVARVLDALRDVPDQRTAKHGPGCWQRHAGCLAQRVRDLLSGREVRP